MKTQIITRKRLISAEVQAEGSRQLQHSSRTSPYTLTSQILQVETLYISPSCGVSSVVRSPPTYKGSQGTDPLLNSRGGTIRNQCREREVGDSQRNMAGPD